MKSSVDIKQQYIWNTLGGLSCSLMSLILLMVVNKIIGTEIGGIFAFAYSHSQLMYTIGTFEVRPLQCTDVKEKFRFDTYFSVRIVTCAVMMVLSVGYIFLEGMTGIKAQVVFWLCLYKMTEAFIDLYCGYYHQMGRIDYTGKSTTFRSTTVTLMFFIVLLISKDIIWAAISMSLVSVVLFGAYDVKIWKSFGNRNVSFTGTKMKELIIEVIPLFLSTFIMMYINNAPKYAINTYCDEITQNMYNVLFMPGFVINMFSVFVFRPMLTTMTIKWNDGKISAFIKDIMKVLMVVAVLTVVCIVGASLLGIPVLSWMYSIDLSQQLGVLLLVMIYGGLNALVAFFYYVVTVMRYQKCLIAAYAFGFVIAFVSAPWLVQKLNLFGAVLSAISAMAAVDIALIIIITYVIMKRSKEENIHE